jgi:hypothetical protein
MPTQLAETIRENKRLVAALIHVRAIDVQLTVATIREAG